MADQIFSTFIPGRPAAHTEPLARYLPPIPGGMVSSWLQLHIPAGAWILDPFGASPRLALEVAQAGYRLLVTANNPVIHFILRIASQPPPPEEWTATLADLAATSKGETTGDSAAGKQRLEAHLSSLYETECARCGRTISAQAFIWERGASAPSGRIYHCLDCDDSGEHPVTDTDVRRAQQFQTAGPYRAHGLWHARAIERVAALDDPVRPFVEEALETYPPRALYALFTLINKIDVLAPQRRHLAQALLLLAFDQANTLWPYPAGRARPRQLLVPSRYREHNVWMAMESSANLWAGLEQQAPVSIVSWPHLPPDSGGISLFEGRLKEYADQIKPSNQPPIPVDAILTALPRPNQAFWTLSALWAGWLWGRESAAALKSTIRRRRYDWGWHTGALQAIFSNLNNLTQPGTFFFGLISEAETGFLTSALLAAELGGFKLVSFALQSEENLTQVTWQRIALNSKIPASAIEKESQTHPIHSLTDLTLQDAAQKTISGYLQLRGEPSPYLPLYAAALEGIVQTGLPEALQKASPSDTHTLINAAIQHALVDNPAITHYAPSDAPTESGYWWLKCDKSLTDQKMTPPYSIVPLADQVEIALVRYLIKRPGSTQAEIDQVIFESFPGLLTPSHLLIEACLSSYAEREAENSNQYRLRAEDAPRLRRADLIAIHQALSQIGQRLAYHPEGESPLTWQDEKGEVYLAFYILASALLGKTMLSTHYPAEHCILVLPGSRASLALFKINNDPRLTEIIDAGWRFLKYRHVRLLADNTLLTRQNLNEQLALDPLSKDDRQMQLF